MRWIRYRLMVLLLLFLPRVPRSLSPRFFAFVLLVVGCISAVPVGAEQRTFVLTPADLVTMTDVFGAKALSRSAALGHALGLRRGALRFAKSTCPSLLADPTRRLTRVRILAGPDGPPPVVGRSLQRGLTDALRQMNAATWFPPATGTTRQAYWTSEPPIAGALGFTTVGFAIGVPTGALGASDAASRLPGFRVTVDLTSDPGIGAAEIALALTSELPSTRVGRPGKRTECVLVAPLLPVDIHALRDLVNAASLTTVTNHRLNFILDTMQNFLDHGSPSRAARNARSFALEVAQRTASEIPPAFAEPMINRANAAAEALSF